MIIGTTSRTSGFVRSLESRLKRVAAKHSNVDGVVAIAHTEAGNEKRPNNYELVMRTLCNYTVHSNIAAVLIGAYDTDIVSFPRGLVPCKAMQRVGIMKHINAKYYIT